VALSLTAYDAGDLYLSGNNVFKSIIFSVLNTQIISQFVRSTVIANTDFQPVIRKLNFDEFWELLVGCALQAYKDKNDITLEDKVILQI